MLKSPWPVLVLLLLCPIACGKADSSAKDAGNRNENVLKIDIPAPFGSLDPCSDSTSGSTSIFPLLYSFLFVPDDEGRLEPDLALRWDHDAESSSWSIQLRNDAFFHDGRPVTSRDVEYSLLRFFKNERPCVFPLIDGITRSSETSLSIRLKEGEAGFLMKIWDIPIVQDPGEASSCADNRPVGSGPFMYDYRKGEREVALAAYERYHGGRPSLDGVLFTYEPDREKSWARLLSGKTDIGGRLYPKDWEIINRIRDRFYFAASVHPYYTLLLYNTADPLFADPNVRLALALAVDRQAIVDRVLLGAGVVAIGPAGVNTPYHNPDLQPVPYDPERGMELLRQAGWAVHPDDDLLYREGRPFEFTILVFKGNAIDRRVAESLQLFLGEFGIRTHLQALPQDELMQRYGYHNDFQAVLTEFWADPRMPEIMQQLWAGMNGQGAAAGLFNDPRVNGLFDEAVQVCDLARKKELYQEIDALITSLQPGMFLFQKTRFDVMSRRFHLPQRFSFDYAGTYRLRRASLANP